MGRMETTTVVWACDRCGKHFPHPHQQRSYVDLTSRWTMTGLGGDVGGATDNQWLCSGCTEAYRAFLNNKTVYSTTEKVDA